MRKRKVPTVWIHPDKFTWLAKLKATLGEAAFIQLSEDEKDKQAFELYEEETVDAELKELASILIDQYIEQKQAQQSKTDS